MLDGKRIMVTGAARGIGRAIALECARAGATVGINYLTSEREAEALREEIATTTSGAAGLCAFDVRDPAAIAAATLAFCERHGGLDGWVNNAGVHRAALLVASGDESVREQIEVNLLGAIHCARAALRPMISQRAGVIINIGSVSARHPSRGQAVYAATKGALESLTRALAVEYGRKGVRVHCLSPGPIDTAMLGGAKALAGDEIARRVPLGRLGRPSEVAALAVFLLSDQASYLTGGSYPVDGGFPGG